MQVKLNPASGAKVNFPGFQEILDFTSAGSESSVSITVASDTDKEYKIFIRNLDASDSVNLLLGGDTSTYSFQALKNTAGTVAAARDTSEATIIMCPALSLCNAFLISPTSSRKSLIVNQITYTSGTTIGFLGEYSYDYDGTSAFTSLDFSSASGNFTSGTQITVYARRSNT